MPKAKRKKPVLTISIQTNERLEYLLPEVKALLKKMGEPAPTQEDTP